MIYHCCTERRRNAIRKHPDLNGIDFLEVRRQKVLLRPGIKQIFYKITLELHFLKALAPIQIAEKNILIKGGERIKNVQVKNIIQPIISTPPDGSEKVLQIELEQEGDFSIYELCLVEDNNKAELEILKGIDTQLSRIAFSFKVDCDANVDCKAEPIECVDQPTEVLPEINYLAKDYTSFKQLMYDRLAMLIPNWETPNPASIESTLVELLAYTADYLSYRQDAISTEAYLRTSRKRISVKRHARLVDYHMHDGCNARTWLHLQVIEGTSGVKIEKGKGNATTRFFTKVESVDKMVFDVNSKEFDDAIVSTAIVFEPMEEIELYYEHNQFNFYTYGEEACCLPKGATEASLLGKFENLKAGDILILSEFKDPNTGKEEDANAKHQHVVRLIEVSYDTDINLDYYLDSSSPPQAPTLDITKIKWGKEDALPFPLCISTKEEDNVSVAYGNNILVDHGLTYEDQVGNSSIYPNEAMQKKHHVYANGNKNGNHCNSVEPTVIPVRYNPILKRSPLTFAVDLEKVYPKPEKNEDNYPTHKKKTAFDLQRFGERDTLPSIKLYEVNDDETKGNEWIAKKDLLTDSAANDRHFVVEVEADSIAYIRFGNDLNGMRPNAETKFIATYRIGNGLAGNIGAKTLVHTASHDPSVRAALSGVEAKIWNPLAASMGKEAETMEEVKQYAPQAFRTQKRAVTTSDYEILAKQCNKEVQKATAKNRWTGSWRTTFVSVDRRGNETVDKTFSNKLLNCLEEFRMAGTDLAIDEPIFIALDIAMEVCVLPNYFKGDIEKILQREFSNRVLPNGHLGFFHPDNFSFGQPLYLSSLHAMAQRIQGVQSVKVTKFQRLGDDSTDGRDAGILNFGRYEIARLDNDPNFKDRGVLEFIMKGGR